MEFFVTSDIHADFWVQAWQPKFNPSTDVYEPHFDKIYDWFFQPAENLIIAGDIANDETTYVAFVKYISTKYKNVYICPGNHDFVVKGATLFKNGHACNESMKRWFWMKEQCLLWNNNITFLDDGQLHEGIIAGTYGSCDLYSGSPFEGYTDRKLRYKTWFDCRTQDWELFNTGYRADPTKLWRWQKEIMMNAVQQHPMIMVTHFCPAELGHHKSYDNSSSNAYFYFNGKDFLEEMPDGSVWICGHIHQWGETVYTNSKGHKITIMARPQGYPGENPVNDGFYTHYDLNGNATGQLCGYDKNKQIINIEAK